ncbi:DUF3343 domain-containing protein [Marinilabilia rubra]|uniref:Putative Se/S carrier protein-like domain-containing protein n=1 Tax=Marinilabilia rubra TaxID=2162893 RepID=A0A2U2B4W0_9BACT|nr:DUF3343 domain-containing protein [Marinilabilia rubra]PWD98108.1 hypothetical protein DDZ16_17355 [Marinilabilia rubra]
MTDEKLLLFPNVHKVMKADRICRMNGIPCRVIPVPEHISSECGMCLLVPPDNWEKCKEILKAESIRYEINN